MSGNDSYRRNFLLDPLLPEAPGQSFISDKERAGNDDDQVKEIDNSAKAEYSKAKTKIDSLLIRTRPKNLPEGVRQGIDTFVFGSVGAIGIAVIAPTAMGTIGAENGGCCGALCGVFVGCFCGCCAAMSICAVSVCGCCLNVCRGVAATPEAILQPRRGNYWDENEGKWVNIDLNMENEHIKSVPEDDHDILGEARAAANADTSEMGSEPSEVSDMLYYDALKVDPSATTSQIKHSYYKLARQYHPDKIGAEDKDAVHKFQEISEAYNVLSDTELREEYDATGVEGLTANRSSVSSTFRSIDPSMMFAFLFGSDKFYPYVGRLAAATAAEIADSSRITADEVRIVQRRRCVRLAFQLLDRIECYVLGDEEGTKAVWLLEAQELTESSYGFEMVNLIGMIYSLSATQFIGSLDSGIGLPSIGMWAASRAATRELIKDTSRRQKKTIFAGLTMLQGHMKLQRELKKATQDDKKRKLEQAFQKEMAEAVLTALWTTTSVDITNSIHTACQMLLFDRTVDNKSRLIRAKAIKALGDIFLSVEKQINIDDIDTPLDAQEIYEKAAFAALLEIIKRKDEARFDATNELNQYSGG
eukprot:CAMPEP_0197836832 /NCGR_PEP_ID=MMETSP1437-20131217/30178_1 /TAXON_ID=49252 ORGANISM="Eucampia antarctica, Strain CCMP1452" /NCGR_SAMPLE_ID=MMETSP1437 /ASSEMBLY_ACC=CAM_ASM_001096 /LENGTH=587 /DNA_ID=CAMNT_0043443329 /DNA_START=75 /DNA_END=1838 /DNA_ORIENTATION=-